MGLNFEGGDFGFVGGSNTMPDPYQDRQRSFNYYPEISNDPRSKTPIALLGCPGLNSILDFTVMTSGTVFNHRRLSWRVGVAWRHRCAVGVRCTCS
jgi:hypothetical protein